MHLFCISLLVSDSGSIDAAVVKKKLLVPWNRFNFNYILPYASPEQW